VKPICAVDASRIAQEPEIVSGMDRFDFSRPRKERIQGAEFLPARFPAAFRTSPRNAQWHIDDNSTDE
jgi:hypothetical protein